jgi:ATP-dependent helicase/nuclease subunit A
MTITADLAGQKRRQRAASDPHSSVWVAASAGSGKTRALVDRVVRLLLAGTRPQRILCLTYTKAAAAEMANRIREVLGRWATADEAALDSEIAALTGERAEAEQLHEARRLFAAVLEAPGGLKIETIHGFCQSLLRRFPLEAGLDPHFDLLDERTGNEILAAAREEVLARTQREDGGAETATLAAALKVLSIHLQGESLDTLIRRLADKRGRFERLKAQHGGIDGIIAQLYHRLGVAADSTPQSIIEAACADSAFDGTALRRAATALLGGSKTDAERAARMLAWLKAAAEERVVRFADYRQAFLTAKWQIPQRLATKGVLGANPGIGEILEAEASRLFAVHESWKAVTVVHATTALLLFGDAVLEAFARHKSDRGLLDYEDLILEARRLLEDPGAAWVLYKLDGGLDHLLIDEAQDTSPEQWEIIGALANEFFAGEGARGDHRTIFAVGDEKQSIFSFQGADPRGFEKMRRHFEGRVQEARKHWRSESFDLSYRSTRAVLDLVDAVFADPQAREGLTAEGREIRHAAVRAGQAGMVELWPPEQSGKEDAATDQEDWSLPLEIASASSAEARLARRIAARIRRFVVEKEILESRNRPIRAGDIMVLVRRRTAFVNELIRALKEHEVPVSGVDRMVLADQLAILDLAALGEFLLLPDDDLTLATVLKGPLIGFSEERLFELAQPRETRPLWRELIARRAENPDFRTAHALLHDLLGRADFVPPYELYAEILGPRGGRQALVSRLGPDAADPIDEFLTLTLGYERENVPSLQGFLHWLRAGDMDIKRELEGRVRDEVRVMTVHGAKGLEAPIVFLPDALSVPGAQPGPPEFLWSEDKDLLLWPPRKLYDEATCEAARQAIRRREMEEYRRLLYVGLTRASDRLVVCGWRGKKKGKALENCWHALLSRAFERLPGVERFDCDGAEGLRYRTPQTLPPENEREGPAPVLKAGPLPAWARRAARAEALPAHIAPSRLGAAEPPARSPLGAEQEGRFMRGRLIHRLLEVLAPLPSGKRRAAAQRILALPSHGLKGPARSNIEEEVLRLLDTPEFAPLFGPDSRAEVMVAGEVGGRFIAGQIDRLLIGPDEVRIVDYKTDREPPENKEGIPISYIRQMAAYRGLLQSIYPDRPVRCALLWTVGPRLIALNESVLDSAFA